MSPIRWQLSLALKDELDLARGGCWGREFQLEPAPEGDSPGVPTWRARRGLVCVKPVEV